MFETNEPTQPLPETKPSQEDDRSPSPLQAIRIECLDCCNGSAKEVRLCPAYACPLWPWRMGKATGQRRPAGEETGGLEGE